LSAANKFVVVVLADSCLLCC